MEARVADRLVVPGARASRVGVVLEVVTGSGAQRYRVRWSDGHQSIVSPGPGARVDRDTAADELAEWEAAKAARHARTTAWRRGITAGVGREAAKAQEAIGSLVASGG